MLCAVGSCTSGSDRLPVNLQNNARRHKFQFAMRSFSGVLVEESHPLVQFLRCVPVPSLKLLVPLHLFVVPRILAQNAQIFCIVHNIDYT
jgi:hypothetical protein